MRSWKPTAVLAGLLSLAVVADLPAQGRGSTSTGGLQSGGGQTSGAQSTGGTGGSSGSGSGGSSLFGGSSTGAGAGGGGGRGNASGGSQAGSALQGPQFNQFGQAAATVGDGFVGRSDNMGRFVGTAGAGQQTLNGNAFTNFGGLGGGGAGGGRGAAPSAQTRGAEMRIQQRIAFTVPAVPPVAIQSRVQAQFVALEGRFPNVVPVMDAAGQLTLTGTVESPEARALAAAVARLEPGVRSVDNQLEVAAVPGAPPSGPLMPPVSFGN